ncbi:endolytic transglycosylase MltG [Piscinibacter sakaiensis]|uniref:Endolytic murein transglycosylase n=1 Tax=Piscinibacter sakaiensis TaxID=1547922 RepID=A0A0K8NWF6_PISS1|nr:endolytic transglycosylase MltG [Piscinibacter sakaiensis]GAP34706.1 protein YceG like [Piscinibacter sakaiensis]
MPHRRPLPPSRRRLRPALLGLGVLLLAAFVGAATALLLWLARPLPLAGASAELSIEPGTSPREIAQGWIAAGVRTSPWLLYEWFRWSGDARRIRAGSYEIDADTTPRQLLAKMVRGDETLATVRLIEGWTFRQFRAELARAEGLKPTTAGLGDAELMAAIGAPGVAPEGRFYPDTYAYSKGSTDLAVLQRAYRAMEHRLAAAWAERDPATPLRSADEALTLASIVEKETGLAADRGKVAGVFANRLRLAMPLQTDPTVIYGLGTAFDGNLRKIHLQTDTPYNTYTRSGLPPTPIAMPGKASLLAAVRPEATRALYFVARGDGSSEFSDNLAAHNRAVGLYQRGGKPPAPTP